MNTAVEIPQYQCHKIVRATKITGFRANGNPDGPDILLGAVGGIVSLMDDWHAKHKPQVGGYYVVYDDGYTSYSPASVFEAGYTALSDRPTSGAGSIGAAFDTLKTAMKEDPGYAWSWHCNLAMPIMDAIGVSHADANKAAALLM